MFLKDRQVSSLGCFPFEFWVLRFRDLGAPFSSFGCFVFEIWVLRFRDLGASFSRFGCFVLRSSFSKLPETGTKNRCVIEVTHFLRRKLRERLNLKLFRNMSVHEFYRLKALITLEQVNTSKKKKQKEESSMVRRTGRVL